MARVQESKSLAIVEIPSIFSDYRALYERTMPFWRWMKARNGSFAVVLSRQNQENVRVFMRIFRPEGWKLFVVERDEEISKKALDLASGVDSSMLVRVDPMGNFSNSKVLSAYKTFCVFQGPFRALGNVKRFFQCCWGAFSRKFRSRDRILLCVAHFNPNPEKCPEFLRDGYLPPDQSKELLKVLCSYDSWGVSIDVHIDLIERIDLPRFENLRIAQHTHPADLTYKLTQVHRKRMRALLHNYDFFLYSENDLIVKWETFEHLFEINRSLPSKFAAGMLRFEEQQGQRVLLELNKKFLSKNQPSELYWRGKISGRELLTLGGGTFHQGCFALDRRRLHTAIAAGYFEEESTRLLTDLAITAASEPFFLIKMVFDPSELDLHLIHHVSQRRMSESTEHHFFTLEELKETLS